MRVVRAPLDPIVAARVVALEATGEARTERELAILWLAARGLTNKQIGAELAVSDRTAQNHLATT